MEILVVGFITGMLGLLMAWVLNRIGGIKLGGPRTGTVVWTIVLLAVIATIVFIFTSLPDR
jgi:hypothetical protein